MDSIEDLSTRRRLSPLVLGEITRLLRTVRGLKGRVYLVGGIVTEGSSLRDIDIIVQNLDDIDVLKKALGKFASRTHFSQQKGEPPTTEFVRIKGVDGSSPDSIRFKKGQTIPKNEYANP